MLQTSFLQLLNLLLSAALLQRSAPALLPRLLFRNFQAGARAATPPPVGSAELPPSPSLSRPLNRSEGSISACGPLSSYCHSVEQAARSRSPLPANHNLSPHSSDAATGCNSLPVQGPVRAGVPSCKPPKPQCWTFPATSPCGLLPGLLDLSRGSRPLSFLDEAHCNSETLSFGRLYLSEALPLLQALPQSQVVWSDCFSSRSPLVRSGVVGLVFRVEGFSLRFK